MVVIMMTIAISNSGAIKKWWALSPHTLPSLVSHGKLYNLVEFSYTISQVAFSQSLNRSILLSCVCISCTAIHSRSDAKRMEPQGNRYYLPRWGGVWSYVCAYVSQICQKCLNQYLVICLPNFLLRFLSRLLSH